MIHLRTLSTVCTKSVIKSYKSPISRSKLLNVFFKPEFTSSPTQLIRLLNIEQTSRESSTKIEDDTDKEVTKTLTPSTANEDGYTNLERVRGENLNEDGNRIGMRMKTSVEAFKQYVTEVDTMKIGEAVRTLNRFCGLFGSKYFPILHISRVKNVESYISSNELKEVFNGIEKKLTFLNYPSLRKLLEACTILNISDTSSLMQKLIKLLSSNINSMSSLDVAHIYCIIEAYYSEENPQIAALSTACKEFFKYNFESRFNQNSDLVRMARYVSHEPLPVNVRELLIRTILERKSNLPLWSYTNIIKGLLLQGVFEDYEFRSECINCVIKNVKKGIEHYEQPREMYNFLRTYKLGIINRIIPYDEAFLDTFASSFVETRPPLLLALECYINFLQLSHFSSGLFNYVLSKVRDDSSLELLKSKPNIIFNLTKFLSGATKPTEIMDSSLRDKLEAVLSDLPKVKTDIRVQLPFNLAILGIYQDHLLEHCFTSEDGGELTEKDIEGYNDYTRNMLLLLHQAVVTFHPSYQKPLLSENLMARLATNNYVVSPAHNMWQQVVESCFGGPNFVMKNCTTPLNHRLSYVVLLDADNVPIDVTSLQKSNSPETDQPFNIADIPNSEGKKMVVIQDVYTEGNIVFRNVSSWKGHFQLYLNVLEAHCDGVIPLLISEFKTLNSSERVPFVLRKIEEKFGVLGQPMSAKSEN